VATTSGDAEAVRAYLAQQGLSFPTLVDEDGSVGRTWGVKGVPASFVVDADGQVAHAAVGYTTELGLRLRLWLAGR
jgi:peroxiredoxin